MNRKLNLLETYNYPKKEIENLIELYKKGQFSTENNIIKESVTYAPEDAFLKIPEESTEEYDALRAAGERSINMGQLGIVVLNGGMATRFGGRVKGTVEVFEGKSFLELKIRDVCKISEKIKIFIMNSFSTEQKTKQLCLEKKEFGVKSSITMFNQFIAPRLNMDGSYYQSEDDLCSFYGPGHGDFPYALKASGCLDSFIDGGGRYIFFSNVDNLGARVDPVLLGIHIRRQSELTAEIAKKNPGDVGGAPAIVDGKLRLVEGFCFPDYFDHNKVDVFNCSTYWVNAESLKKEFILPWYVVNKKVCGHKVVQFERLAGDMSCFFKTNYLKVPRNKRFFPIKTPQDLKDYRSDLKMLLGY